MKPSSFCTLFTILISHIYAHGQNIKKDSLNADSIPDLSKNTHAAFRFYKNWQGGGDDTLAIEYFLLCNGDTINEIYIDDNKRAVKMGFWVEYRHGYGLKSIGYYAWGRKVGKWKTYSEYNNQLASEEFFIDGWVQRSVYYYAPSIFGDKCDTIEGQPANEYYQGSKNNPCVREVTELNNKEGIYVDSSFYCCSKTVSQINYILEPDRIKTGPTFEFEDFNEGNSHVIKTDIFDNKGTLVKTVKYPPPSNH